MRRFSLLVFSCLLASAVLAQTLDEQELREQWSGRHRDELTAAWGEPAKVKRRKRKQVLVFKNLFSCGVVVRSSPTINVFSAPSEVDPGGGYGPDDRPSDPFPHEPTVKWDKTKVTFFVDAEGKIEDLRLSLPSKRQQQRCAEVGRDDAVD